MLASGMFLPILALQGPINPLVAAALVLTLLIIILFYLFAKFLSSPQLEAFAREEFSQFIFTALIFASFGLFYGIITVIFSAAVCGGPVCDHFGMALYSLDLVKSRLVSTYLRLYAHEFAIGILSSIGFYVPLMPINSPIFLMWVTISPFSGLEPVSNALITIIEAMGYLFALAYGRKMLIYFFRDMTPLLLFIGFLMRAMPFSRRTGSSLIAIAFAGYFAYPFSIILSHYMIGESLGSMDVVSPPPAPLFCNAPAGYVERANNETIEAWATGLTDLRQQEGFFEEHLGVLGAILDDITGFLRTFFRLVLGRYNFDLLSPNMNPFIHFAYFFAISKILTFVQFAVMVLITFVFEIIITVTAFRSLSFSLGGEMEILGLTRVV